MPPLPSGSVIHSSAFGPNKPRKYCYESSDITEELLMTDNAIFPIVHDPLPTLSPKMGLLIV
jgi:hypothetical protein